MFQSNVNLFGNASSFLSIQQLKKILRIPQDQLSKLNNIPGWSACEKTVPETSTVLPHKERKKDSEKEVSIKQNCLNKPDINSSNCVNSIANKKLSNSNYISKQEFSFFNCEKSSLSRSKSLNYLNIESSLVCKKLKRSFSLSNMEKSLAQKSDLNFPFLQKKNEEPELTRKFFVEKAYFTDSAVQCKMSQSSQPVFEMPLSERIELLTANKKMTGSEDINNEQEIKSASKCEETKLSSLPIASALQSVSESKIELKRTENVIGEGKNESSVETSNKNINEESFASQVVPCAQPCPKNAVLTNDQKFASSTSHFNNHPAVPPNKSLENKRPTTKRKRYNKLEKDSKKMKSLGNVDIVYSSEQIKNMIEMMKTVFK